MSTEVTSVEIEYPESDGVPMGESDLHRNWIVRIIQRLEYHYRNQRAYVTGDLLLYYVEGSPRTFIVPDVFLVKDHPRGMRGIYKLWKEGKPPDIAFEITSHTTHREDIAKFAKYFQIGVKEVFLFDPTEDYLSPQLQGYRLTSDDYDMIPRDAKGRIHSEELNADLFMDGEELFIVDSATGAAWLTADEAAELERDQAEDERDRVASERDRVASERDRVAGERDRVACERDGIKADLEAERARIASLEAELERLRAQLGQRPEPKP